MKKVLRVSTTVGEFTRTTQANYTHVCVREPLEGAAAFVEKYKTATSGVHGRYVKDRGYIVSWHNCLSAAANQAAHKISVYYVESRPIGVFKVS